ncbi:MAG: hypothetical protein Q9227_007186 [Pyrenula ochraceoflavens]
MVELRKRKEAPAAPAPPPTKKSNPIKKAAAAVKDAVTGDAKNGDDTPSTSDSSTGGPSVNSTVQLTDFGGTVTTNAGESATLKSLVDNSTAGVVLFTYPKANTPGCTTQACMFRDAYPDLTSTGFSIYGLSADSAKSNTTFQTKNSLPYPLLCDAEGTLIDAIGMKKPGQAKGTVRGVFVVDKQGKVLLTEKGGPQATVDAVAALIKKSPGEVAAEDTKAEAQKDGVDLGEERKMDEVPVVEEGTLEEVRSAETAAEVADTAEKVDGV